MSSGFSVVGGGGENHVEDFNEAARRGLILLSCGIYGNVIRVLVPLTAADAIVDEGLKIMADSFAAQAR